MKKKIMVMFCSALILVLAGCTLFVGRNLFSKDRNADKKVQPKANLEKTALSKELTAPPETEAVVSLVIASNPGKEEPETDKPVTPAKTKSVNTNGKTYTADFKEVTISDNNNKREINVYSTDDNSINLKYDRMTGDLLYAKFRTSLDAERKISKEQAKKIAEAFIKTQCQDFELYIFDGITENESSGYFVNYSKHIGGYRTKQTILILVRFNGNIGLYSHNKFAFDGIDTNVKIDADKLAKELDEKIKSNLVQM